MVALSNMQSSIKNCFNILGEPFIYSSYLTLTEEVLVYYRQGLGNFDPPSPPKKKTSATTSRRSWKTSTPPSLCCSPRKGQSPSFDENRLLFKKKLHSPPSSKSHLYWFLQPPLLMKEKSSPLPIFTMDHVTHHDAIDGGHVWIHILGAFFHSSPQSSLSHPYWFCTAPLFWWRKKLPLSVF